MCAQCTSSGAIVVTAAATGARVWLAAVAPQWFNGQLKRWVSCTVVVSGVLSAALVS